MTIRQSPRFLQTAPLATSLLVLLACNPTGTCVETGESKGELGSACIINTNKGACSSYGTPREFHAESGPAGIMRCKSAGFDSDSRPTAPTALHIFYKKPPAKTP